MKILILFDVARRTSPDETFSETVLKQEDKPTEADVLGCLKRLGEILIRVSLGVPIGQVADKAFAIGPRTIGLWTIFGLGTAKD